MNGSAPGDAAVGGLVADGAAGIVDDAPRPAPDLPRPAEAGDDVLERELRRMVVLHRRTLARSTTGAGARATARPRRSRTPS